MQEKKSRFALRLSRRTECTLPKPQISKKKGCFPPRPGVFTERGFALRGERFCSPHPTPPHPESISKCRHFLLIHIIFKIIGICRGRFLLFIVSAHRIAHQNLVAKSKSPLSYTTTRFAPPTPLSSMATTKLSRSVSCPGTSFSSTRAMSYLKHKINRF